MRSRRTRITLALALLAVVIPTTIALSRPGATLHAPGTVRLGGVVRVTGSDLQPGMYSLTLVSERAPKDAACQTVVAHTPVSVTRVTFTVRLPRRLPCVASTPATRAGSIAIVGGEYQLVLAVYKHGGISPRYSSIRHALRIT